MNAEEIWRTKPWREIPREVRIEDTKDDEIKFLFLDNRKRSVCALVAFLRTYEPC